MPTSNTVVGIRKPEARTRVTNGRQLFMEHVDGRSAEARRFRDVLAQIASDLGGIDRLSEGQRQLARRCALISIECEKMERSAVAGEAIDLEAFGQLTDRLGRAFGRLGLKRVARDVTPNLKDYLKANPT